MRDQNKPHICIRTSSTNGKKYPGVLHQGRFYPIAKGRLQRKMAKEMSNGPHFYAEIAIKEQK